MGKARFAAQRKGQSMPRSNWLAQVPASVLALVLALAFAWVLSGCGGGGGAASDSGGAATAPAANVNQDPPAGSVVNVDQEPPASMVEEPAVKRTLQAAQPGELLAYVKAKLKQRQQLRADRASNYVEFSTTGNRTSSENPFNFGASVPAPERTSTVIQEDGVDEADIIKSNGSILVTLSMSYQGQQLNVHRVLEAGRLQPAANFALDGLPKSAAFHHGFYLAPGSPLVAVLGNGVRDALCSAASDCNPLSPKFPTRGQDEVLLNILSVADPDAPALTRQLRIDGALVGSRLVGNSLVLVTRFSPSLAADALPWTAPAAEVNAAIQKVGVADLLPTIHVNNVASSPLVQESECFIEPNNANYSLSVISITVFDLVSESLSRNSRCFIGEADALYMSMSALYLATTSHMVPPINSLNRLVYPTQTTTDIHKFAFVKAAERSEMTVDFRGSGSVFGHLGWSAQQRSYRMSEHNGDLRVITFTGQTGWGAVSDAGNLNAPAPSPATLTILREHPGQKKLFAVGKFPNKDSPQAIGKPGEQVYAVRFIGDRGYVVTFRQLDPLYILDLSKPEDPKATGELTTAGFSNYLFHVGPAGSGLLVGVGKDANERGVTTGVKVALFDVADSSRPTQKSTFTIGDGGYSALDYSRVGIDLLTLGNQTKVVLPVLSWDRANQSDFAGTRTYSSALQRFEVDASNRSMKLITPLAQTATIRSVGQERTLQIGSLVHHFASEVSVDTVASYEW